MCCQWKTQCSGTVPHLSQLRQFQDENAKLNLMHANLALVHHGLNGVLAQSSKSGNVARW